MTAVSPGTFTGSVLDYMVQQYGWTYRTRGNPRERYTGPCPVGNHDNDDIDPRFSIHANRNSYKCWKCNFEGHGLISLGKQLGVEFHPTRRTEPVNGGAQVATAGLRQPPTWQGATVDQLCEAKGIDRNIADYLHWSDTMYGRGKRQIPAVQIPYYDQQGNLHDYRYRVGIDTGTRIVSRRGSTLIPYGLWQMDLARKDGYIILVEGETDLATLDTHQFNGLGIPGVTTFKPEWAVYLQGIDKIYVWEEPGGKQDRHGRTPGQQMVHRISRYVGQVWVMKGLPEAKDPCALAQLLGEQGFPVKMWELMSQAQPYEAQPEQVGEPFIDPSDVWTIPTTQVDAHSHSDNSHSSGEPSKPGRVSWAVGNDCKHIHFLEERNSKSRHKPVNLLSLIYRHQRRWEELNVGNAEFCYIPGYGVKLCIYMENQNLKIDHKRLEGLVAGSLGMIDLHGNEVPAYKQVSECGGAVTFNCDEHGPQYDGKHSCNLHFDPACSTIAAKKLAKVTLPSLEGTGRYCHAVIETKTPLPEAIEWWGNVFSDQVNAWEHEIGRISRWKEYRGQIYSRAQATYYRHEPHSEQVTAITHWKILLHESEPGQADRALEHLAETMGGELVLTQRWQEGTTAVLQTIADFMTHLVGIEDTIGYRDQCLIFAAHYFATKGRHLFQCFGVLREKLLLIPAPEPLVCPKCGRKLREVMAYSNTVDRPKSQARYDPGSY